eukprot:TRINITY_DN11038_c3_g1_i1.p1 TRINITY_DN11038_c3_g1~~TRINITY_DN11038_c3_g1_i1.p1  ORF type:complete len:530 (-),score=94.06 TRINITY_DN11038_c3_g1_i1:106-1587(-)
MSSKAKSKRAVAAAAVGVGALGAAQTCCSQSFVAQNVARTAAGGTFEKAAGSIGSATSGSSAAAFSSSSSSAAAIAVAGAGVAALGAAHRSSGRSKAAGSKQRRNVAVARNMKTENFENVCEQSGITLSRYMIEATKRGVVDDDIQSIFNSIREATKVISKLVNRAPLSQVELLGLQGEVNVQGEDQKKLDVITNDVLKKALSYTGKLGTMASEEEETPVVGSTNVSAQAVLAETGKYVCVFDPLDGSSNVDAGIAVGTIFGIFKELEDAEECAVDISKDLSDEQAACLAGTLQPGKALVAAGYVLYSCSTEMVFTIGRGCVGFTLDSSIGEYVLTRPQIKIPARGKIYSANEANIDQWDEPMRQYIQDIQSGNGETGDTYSLRYLGSMVGDVHRTLLYGGIFAYPADKTAQNGKLRLLYEAAPMSFLLEQAGGASTTGHSRVMDIPPVTVHQRVPVILGSKDDVEECKKYYSKSTDPTLKERCQRRLQGFVA